MAKRRKRWLAMLTLLLVAVMGTPNVQAAESMPKDALQIEIISPDAVKAKPVYNGEVKIKVTNQSDVTVDNTDLFLSVVDAERGQSFPMDEFGENSYQTRTIPPLAAGESTDLTIPIRVMYVGDFRIVANIVDYKSNMTYVSNALPIHMTSDSHLNKSLVIGVAVVTPIVLFVIAAMLYKKRGRKKK